MQERYRLRREEAYRDGAASFDVLAVDPTFRDFVCLYIAEGYKRDRNRVSICNSDPAVMVLATRWLRRLTERVVAFSVQYHADQDPVELLGFWSETLEIEPGRIRFQRKSNSGRLKGRQWRSRHGVIAAFVHDTLLRARVEAWMDEVRVGWQ